MYLSKHNIIIDELILSKKAFQSKANLSSLSGPVAGVGGRGGVVSFK